VPHGLSLELERGLAREDDLEEVILSRIEV
jgi:hypothetical protein